MDVSLSVGHCCSNISENSIHGLLYEFTECLKSSLNLSESLQPLRNESAEDSDMFLPVPGEDLHNSSLASLYESQLLFLSEVCLTDQVSSGLDRTFRVINTVLGLLSILLLLLTLLVYILLPELHNLHGYLVTSNLLVNILQTAFLLLVFNLSHWLPDMACQILGYLGYFLTMAMFAWMTVLSIDLAWTLNRSRWSDGSLTQIRFQFFISESPALAPPGPGYSATPASPGASVSASPSSSSSSTSTCCS